MQNPPIELPVPAHHPCYADHFPGDPLVPGALLLQWIEARLQQARPGLVIREIRSAKFLDAVRPGAICELIWEHDPDKGAVKVNCRCAGQTACKVHFIVTGG